jgi:hypothetical protein
MTGRSGPPVDDLGGSRAGVADRRAISSTGMQLHTAQRRPQAKGPLEVARRPREEMKGTPPHL